MGTTWPKRPIFGQKCQFWAKFGHFWAKIHFGGDGVKLFVSSYQDSNETPFSCWKHWSVGLKLAARGKNVLFWPQNLDIWGQKSIFCLVIAIFVDGANDHYTRGSNFPIGTTPKKFSVSELGVIFWGSPLFLAVSGHSPITIISTLNFLTIFNDTLWDRPGHKKMTYNDNGIGPGWNYRETTIFTFGRKVVIWPKMHLSQKNARFFLRAWYLFWKRVRYSLNNCFPLWPEHGMSQEVGF